MTINEEQPRDYLGREVCSGCGHTKALHQGEICAAMHCYCKGFLAAVVKRVQELKSA